MSCEFKTMKTRVNDGVTKSAIMEPILLVFRYIANQNGLLTLNEEHMKFYTNLRNL